MRERQLHREAARGIDRELGGGDQRGTQRACLAAAAVQRAAATESERREGWRANRRDDHLSAN